MVMPPPSLLIAMAVMLAIATLGSLAVFRLLRPRPAWAATLAAMVGAGLLVLHAFWLNGNPQLVRLLPVADAIVWTNLSPLFVGVLAAGAWQSMKVPWQRWLAVTVLAGVCVAQAYGPLFGTVPATLPPRVADGVHRQTTLSTCSAAAAATLLERMGFEATEAEMAELCLTRAGGTLQLGLYRGLRLKAPGWSVEFCNGDFDQLLASTHPSIVSLGLPRTGWQVLPLRVGHSVVLLGRLADGSLDIADPMTGRRYPLTPAELRRNWAGEAIQLVPLSNTPRNAIEP